jgi:hypothetical protein
MFFFQHKGTLSDTANARKTQDRNNSNSLLFQLLFSALGGLLAYGILWSMATYPHPILLTILGGLVPVLAATVISRTSGKKRKLRIKRGIMRNPLIAIVLGYLLALTEIFMVREIEAPGLTSSYYPGMKKKQRIATIQSRNRKPRITLTQ